MLGLRLAAAARIRPRRRRRGARPGRSGGTRLQRRSPGPLPASAGHAGQQRPPGPLRNLRRAGRPPGHRRRRRDRADSQSVPAPAQRRRRPRPEAVAERLFHRRQPRPPLVRAPPRRLHRRLGADPGTGARMGPPGHRGGGGFLPPFSVSALEPRRYPPGVRPAAPAVPAGALAQRAGAGGGAVPVGSAARPACAVSDHPFRGQRRRRRDRPSAPTGHQRAGFPGTGPVAGRRPALPAGHRRRSAGARAARPAPGRAVAAGTDGSHRRTLARPPSAAATAAAGVHPPAAPAAGAR